MVMKYFNLSVLLAGINCEYNRTTVLTGEEARDFLFAVTGIRQRSQGPTGLTKFGMNMAAFDYGCHCNAILSGKLYGIGQPVDALDSVCKDYLDVSGV